MKRLTLFSAVRGTVLHHGQPVAGTAVERECRWAWKQEAATDDTVTDARGHFAFPPIERRSLTASLLPHQPHIRQTLRITHAGHTVLAWAFDKGNYRDEGELGRALVLTCALDSEPRHHGEAFGVGTPG